MKKLSVYSIIMLCLFSLTSCEAVETIFKAGMWWGIILVVGIIGIILWLFSRGKNS
ncbi:phosphatidate cytidylyltransferase [Chryseobacterium taiwanense]|uniref:phosphatidate cytidylyltransferase n=1 Tax=Chryseobacterium taiwanense TaxID=363331 RepID=UPI0009FDA3A4|nr:phosphatidate cytidylyltransferase [Chryseobacterium taiwanense]